MAVRAASTEEYESHLFALRPPGPAWPASDPRTGAAASECARVHNRAVDLIDESDPRTTVERLADWERVAGLPGPCATLEETFQERRNALVSQLTSIGGQSPQFFVTLAVRLGYTVTVSEFRPFLAGRATAGDELTNDTWIHRWMIRAPQTTTFDFRAGQGVAGEPLRRWGEELLECAITTHKPAHTDVTFAYGE